MSRDLPAALETAIDEPVVRPFLAVRIELPDPVYVWTGRGTLQFDDSDGISRDWLGAGGLGSIEQVGESADGAATGVRVSLFEVPSEFRDDIADQAERGALFEIYVGALNETYQQVEAVQLLSKWKLDQYKITDGGSSLSVEVSGESRSIDQRRPAIKRFTDEYQKRKHPGDKFFEYVPQMTEVSILWAQASQNAAPIGSGLGGGGGGTYCVSVDSLALMADGSEKRFGQLAPGDMLWTRHERTFDWGAYPVAAAEMTIEPVVGRKGWPDATVRHRFALPAWIARLLPERLRWFRAGWFGARTGEAMVARVTIEGAHTYMARHPSPGSKWRLSHNIKNEPGI